MNILPIARHMKALLFLALFVPNALAGLREPDVAYWGRVILDGAAMTSANTEVTVEARRTATGPAIASYAMGSKAQYNDYYSLRLIVEAGLPLTMAEAVVAGDTVFIVVKRDGIDRDSKTVTIAGKGTVTQVDFGSLDSDNDGLPDVWEQLYFGAGGADPNADPDGDGASNLREFLEGTNPTLADSNHPADRSPADKRISINEVTSYGLAWKTGASWPVGPTPIPVSYVTRAGALWKGGETYKLDHDLSPTAPLWWVNLPVASSAPTATKEKDKAAAPVVVASSVVRSVSGGLVLQLDVTPASSVTAYAIEEQIPSGWTPSEISDGGSFTASQGVVRWGPFFDNVPRKVTYRLSGAGAAIVFNGVASFDGADVKATGVTTLSDPQGTLSLSVTQNQTGLALTIHGLPGQNIAIETSSDLANWSQIGDAKIGIDGTVNLVPAESETQAFFRAHTQAPQ